MDQTQRRKDQFYRVKAKAEGLEGEVVGLREVVVLRDEQLESAAAEVFALKAEVERMRAEHRAEVNRLVTELAYERSIRVETSWSNS